MKVSQFVLYLENTLGLTLDPTLPEWKARSIQAHILMKKIESNPAYFTEENLMLAAEWGRRNRKKPKTAASVCWWVEKALADRSRDVVRKDTLSKRVSGAIAEEIAAGDPDGWAGRLSRASGEARGQVLNDWRAFRGQAAEGGAAEERHVE